MEKTDRILKFRTHDRQIICDQEHTEDFQLATIFKKIHAGNLGLYHKDLFRRYFIPYSDIERIYKQIQIIPVDDSPAYEHYRIIIEGKSGRIAEVLFGEGFMDRTEDNETADELLEALRYIEGAKHIRIGYDEPERKK